MPLSSKRARPDDGAPTIAECTKKVKCLSKGNARAILAGLMASLPVARAVIEAEIAKVDPVDLSVYSHKASDIVCSLECLQAGELLSRLAELADECKEDLSSAQAFAAMVDILGIAHDTNSKVRKQLFRDDAIEGEIAERLENLAEDMSSEEKESISDAVDELERLMKTLGDYGSGYGLENVVTQMRVNHVAAVEGPSQE